MLEENKSFVPRRLPENLDNLVRLCLTRIYFLWNGEYYEQRFGIIRHHLSSPTTLWKLQTKSYVDDAFVIWLQGLGAQQGFKEHLKGQQATSKVGTAKVGSLPFLDVLVK